MLAVISDVHANIAALEAVLRDAHRRRVDAIYCLGDCVGYNALPAQTLARLRNEGVISLKGNHDMMATGELPIAHCGPHARVSLTWTRTVLSGEDGSYLRALPQERRIPPDVLLLHSKLHDPTSYLLETRDYLEQYGKIQAHAPEARICFTGHTHKPRVVEIESGGALRILPLARRALDPTRFYFINPGSVGHPRRSDYRACYALYDPATREVQWRRVAYDMAATRAENGRHGIHTDLGPGVVRYAITQWTERCKAALR